MDDTQQTTGGVCTLFGQTEGFMDARVDDKSPIWNNNKDG